MRNPPEPEPANQRIFPIVVPQPGIGPTGAALAFLYVLVVFSMNCLLDKEMFIKNYIHIDSRI